MDYERAKEILSEIEYLRWQFQLVRLGEYLAFRVVFHAYDPHTARFEAQNGRLWLIGARLTEDELVRTAFLAVMTAEEHETRERFLYRGEQVCGPHFHVSGE